MKRNRIINKALVVSGGLVMLTLMIGVLLVGDVVRADDTAVVQTSITVPVACTLRGTGTDSHTATLAPNTYSGASGSEYENGIGKTTLTAICNDDNGFSIYAIGFTGNSYDSADHTKLVGSSTGGTIATKAYASGDATSNWSMKLTKVTDSTVSYNPTNLTISTDYDSWHAIPDTYTKVAQYKANTGSSTTDTTLGVKLETTYAAFIAQNQPADTYVGQVKYTMVHPYDAGEPLFPQTAQSGCINYFPNGSNVEGTMGCQEITDSDTTITLLASNFSRQGYGFAGWSNKFDYATNSNQEGIKFYGPNEYISFTAGQYTGTNPGLSLYAVWVKSAGSIQDTSRVATVCNGLTQALADGTANLSSVSALTDQRDNETYAIAKLADGNCWMIENLRLDNTNSDNTTGALAQGYDASFVGLANPEGPAVFEYDTSANSLYSTDGSTVMTISGSSLDSRFPRYNNVNTPTMVAQRPASPSTNDATNVSTGAGIYSYGNYYTWAAAIADTTYLTSGTYNTTSICPAGWRVPTGKTAGEFNALNTAVNPEASSYSMERKLRSYPYNFIYAGIIYDGSVGLRGLEGHYWSSTASSMSNAYFFNIDGGYVNPGTNVYYASSKYYGRTIRCITSGA